MKRSVLAMISVLGFGVGMLLGPARSLGHERYNIYPLTPTSACTPMDDPASWGANNGGNRYHTNTSRNLRLTCGMPFEVMSDATWGASVSYYDGNGTSWSGSRYNVWCEGYSYPNINQTYWYSTGRKWGCSTDGGCTTSPRSAFAGHGRLSLGSFNDAAWVKTIACNVPRYTSGRASEITNINLVQDFGDFGF